MPLNSNLTLAPAGQCRYIDGAGANSLAGRENPNSKRRTSAPRSSRRFFCARCSCYGGLCGAGFGLAGCRFGRFLTPVQSVTSFVRRVADGSNTKRSRNHAHKYPYHHTSETPALSLAFIRTRKPPLSA